MMLSEGKGEVSSFIAAAIVRFFASHAQIFRDRQDG